jgi:hypothetical protein
VVHQLITQPHLLDDSCCSTVPVYMQASPSPGGCVLPSPVLAIGCSDGIVRLLHLASLRTFARLVSSHKSSLTSLTVTGVRGVTWEAVIGCFQVRRHASVFSGPLSGIRTSMSKL